MPFADTYPPAAWRLVLSPPADGASNMALDEAILLAVAEGAAPPTLRLFAWQPACLSLGYAQPAAEVDPARLHAWGYDLVRRPTGGRAILHVDELTYSVSAPLTEPRVRGGVVESYQRLSAGLLRGLQRLGLPAQAEPAAAAPLATAGPVCFEVPSSYEITVGEGGGAPRKLLGSAQVRKHAGVLQHGALPLTGDLGRICDVLAFASDEARAAARRRLASRAATVAEVLGRDVSWEEASQALAAGFADALNLTLAPAPLSQRELALAEQLRGEKYATDEWSRRL